jgi:predicted GTPase
LLPRANGATFEEALVREMQSRHVPLVVAFNKSDVAPVSAAQLAALREQGLCTVETSAVTGRGLLDLRQALLGQAPPDHLDSRAIAADLVGPGELAVLVVPIDKEAPKGRLILPQVQVLRDLLDSRRHSPWW